MAGSTHYIALADGKSGAWGLMFPDVPGCTVMGSDLTELHANAVLALREWMADRVADGFEPPAPRAAEELMTEVEGRSTLYIPLLLDAGRSVRTTIAFDAGLLGSIDAAASRRGMTRSAFLASAARDKIKAEG